MRFDVFCQVIDNFGDVGVCWRLAADLAARGHAVRLWVDDASALAWMAPHGAPGVEVRPWPQAAPADGPGDVVIEAFGCEIAPGFIAACAGTESAGGRNGLKTPVWINLEYLSAEGYVERCHRLPSPVMGGPGAGLTRWFFYPGFTARTGGLLREPGLAARQAAFDRDAWRAARGIGRQEMATSLFCYEPPALPALLRQLQGHLLVTPGRATGAVLNEINLQRLLGRIGTAAQATQRRVKPVSPRVDGGKHIGQPHAARVVEMQGELHPRPARACCHREPVHLRGVGHARGVAQRDAAHAHIHKTLHPAEHISLGHIAFHGAAEHT